MASAEELTQRAADLAAIETELQDLAVIDGTTCAGVFTEFVKTDSNQLGGYVPSYDASFYVRTSYFTDIARPNKESTVVIQIGGQSKSFIVDRVHNYPDDIAIELELRSAGE